MPCLLLSDSPLAAVASGPRQPAPAAATTVSGIYAEHQRVEEELRRKRDDERAAQHDALE
eukprot:gene25539-19183_t